MVLWEFFLSRVLGSIVMDERPFFFLSCLFRFHSFFLSFSLASELLDRYQKGLDSGYIIGMRREYKMEG